mgnify:CR=1 FL=1
MGRPLRPGQAVRKQPVLRHVRWVGRCPSSAQQPRRNARGAGGTGLYGKVGFAQVDIDVTQSVSTNAGTYPDTTLDAWTYALGYKAGFGDNGVVKIEGYMTDYDTFKATSTSSNTVSANLDLVGAKLSLGIKF